MIKATCWDFNGVVIADARACFGAVTHVIKHFGGTPPSFQEFQRTTIIPANELYVAHGCDRAELVREGEKLAAMFHETYEGLAGKCRTRSGLRDTLRFLQSRSIPAVIFSNHTEWGVNEQLQRLNLTGLFAGVVANKDKAAANHSQNKKQWVQDHLAQHGYNPAETLIIGDSPEEVEIGKELGMVTVAISGGYFSTDRLRRAQPDHLIRQVSQLIQVITQRD